MLHDIPQEILDQMRRLEEMDARDRVDGTARSDRLRQIPAETGRFLSILAASSPPGLFVEIGTSAGYSSLWLALACRAAGSRLVTYETSEQKAALARETFRLARVEDVVELTVGDARDYLDKCSNVAFCFLDAEKETYLDCYNLVVPQMVRRAILTADNIISHERELTSFLERAESDPRVDCVRVPIDRGVLVCRKN